MHRRPALALAASSLAFSLVLLDTTAVTVALPAIREDLGASLSGLQWIVSGYTLVLASLLISGGALADRIGAKRLMLGGVAIFAVASGAAAAAPSAGWLIAAQVVIGVGGAALAPASLTLLSHAYPDAQRRARALGVWATVSASSFAAGPLLGGLLVDAVGWRLLFVVNLPFAIAVAVLLLRGVDETPRTVAAGIDLSGQISAIVALAALTFAIIESRPAGWDAPLVTGGLLLALVAGAAFVAIERASRAPMLPLGLFASRTFTISVVAGLLLNFAMYGEFFVISLFLQELRGLSALETGLALLPQPVLFALAGIPAGRMVARSGPRVPLVVGATAAALGVAILTAADPTTPYLQLALSFVLFGAGAGAAIPALTSAVVSSVPGAQVGVASAALNAARQTGGVLGIAVIGGMAGTGGALLDGMQLGLAVAATSLAAVALVALALRAQPRPAPRYSLGEQP